MSKKKKTYYFIHYRAIPKRRIDSEGSLFYRWSSYRPRDRKMKYSDLGAATKAYYERCVDLPERIKNCVIQVLLVQSNSGDKKSYWKRTNKDSLVILKKVMLVYYSLLMSIAIMCGALSTK